jgi:hypothetical protein
MSAPKYEWDFDYWPPHRRPPTIDYEQDRRGMYVPRRQRHPIGLGWSLVIVAIAALVLLRFAWAPLLMLAVLLGMDSPSQMFGAIVGAVILGAMALRERLGH